jgi:hypothetical protein
MTLLIRLAFVYSVPIGVVQAITNNQVRLHVITELIHWICSAWSPGRDHRYVSGVTVHYYS